MVASKDLSFDQKKGKFTEGAVRTTPDRLAEIRKDTLDDFKRSTEARDQSVHQMAARLASSAAGISEASTKAPAREETNAVGGEIGAAGGQAQPRFEEMLNLTSNRKLHVKDIASGFKGESRPENMEAFFVRHAQEEAAYRHKVHEGRETQKKTPQATDAMYDFVFKLNLATTEGKERFLRRWAVGRMANGQSTSPREGWKFLKSIGVDVPLPESRASTPSEDLSPAGAPSATPPRGRTRTRQSPLSRGKPAASGSTNKKRGAKPESVAWQEALSRAVGAVSKVDADACATKLANPRLRKSGSEPRYGGRSPPHVPETCRGPRTRAFFGAAATDSLASYQSEDEGAGRGERQRSSWSPVGSSGRMASTKLWQRDSSGPLSQGFRANGDSIETRVSPIEPSCPGTPTTGKGVRLSLNPSSAPPGRFSLSPVRTSDNSRSSLIASDQADVSAASALSAKVSWDLSPPPQDLRLPGRLFDSGEEENEAASESEAEIEFEENESGILDVSEARETRGLHGQEHAYDAESDEYEGYRSVGEDDDSDEGEFGAGPEENEGGGRCEMATVTTNDDGDAAPETVEFDRNTHDNEHGVFESLKASLAVGDPGHVRIAGSFGVKDDVGDERAWSSLDVDSPGGTAKESVKEGPEACLAAVRETLEDLTAGVAILEGDEFRLCTPKDLEGFVSSDAGNEASLGMLSMEDSGAFTPAGSGRTGKEEKHQRQESSGDSVAAAAAAATFSKDLTIDVGDALRDGTPPVPRLEWGVHSMEMGSPITPSCYDDRAPGDHSLQENLGSPQQKEGDDLSLFASGDRDIKPADAGARQPLVETSAISASSSPRVKVSSPWEAFATDIVSPLSPTMIKLSSDLAEALEISRHGPLSGSPRVIVAASPASSFSSEASSSGSDSLDLAEVSETANNDYGAGSASSMSSVDATRSPDAGVGEGEGKSSEGKRCEQDEGVEPPMLPQPQNPYVDFDAAYDTDSCEEPESVNTDCLNLGNFLNFCRPKGKKTINRINNG